MRWSADKVRWLMLGGALLLAGVVAAFFGLANYRAGKIWQRILARNGVNLRRESDGVTWSQSSKGRTIFTLHAGKAIPEGKDRWVLHDAVLILYGREPGRDDRIYGKEFEYDQQAGTAHALGDVEMDLQVPEASAGKHGLGGGKADLSFATEDKEANDPAVIHVHTSGLTYVRKLGVAATDQPTEFRYGGITCTARGAEFDSGQSTVRLLADVHMRGMLKRTPFTLTAEHAELDRTANTVQLASPIAVSGDRSGRAQHAVLHLNKDGSIAAGEANGTVQLRSGTQAISGAQLAASFGADNRPKQARLFGGVAMEDTKAARSATGSAEYVELGFGDAGVLSSVVANGNVAFAQRAAAATGALETRQMKAQAAVASFAPAGRRSELQRVHMTGGAELSLDAPPRKADERATSTRVDGDALTAFFGNADGKSVVQRLVGSGHTQMRQSAATGARQASSGDALEIIFSASPGLKTPAADGQVAVSTAVQTGNVFLQSWGAPRVGEQPGSDEPTTGHAARAVYAEAEQTLTLSGTAGGHADVRSGDSQISAEQIVLHQETQDSEADGGVVATSAGKGGQAAIHVLASRATQVHATDVTQFFGTDALPARLWQSGSQVEAASITWDGRQRMLFARPERPSSAVHAVFATAPETKTGKGSGPERSKADAHGGPMRTPVPVDGRQMPLAERSALRVAAARMDYDDARRVATFVGDVRAAGAMGEVTGARGAAFLQPAVQAATPAPKPDAVAGVDANLGGTLDRIVMLGDVRLEQQGREGLGEQLTYVSGTNSFVLTGTAAKPPRVTGEQGTVVTGPTLLFGATDSTIVVAGTQGDSKRVASGRVHTETDLKQ